MHDLALVRARLGDAARFRTGNSLLLVAADLTVRRLIGHVAAGTMTPAAALAVALAAENAALSVDHVSPPECPHDRARISL